MVRGRNQPRLCGQAGLAAALSLPDLSKDVQFSHRHDDDDSGEDY